MVCAAVFQFFKLRGETRKKSLLLHHPIYGFNSCFRRSSDEGLTFEASAFVIAFVISLG